MTDHILSTPGQATVTCAQLPGQEMELAHREMVHAAGGFGLLPTGPILFIRLVAEIINYYLDDGS